MFIYPFQICVSFEAKQDHAALALFDTIMIELMESVKGSLMEDATVTEIISSLWSSVCRIVELPKVNIAQFMLR